MDEEIRFFDGRITDVHVWHPVDVEAPVPDLEAWARRTIDEAPISEWEFRENLPLIGRLGRRYGFETLREMFVTMTSAGIPFDQVLRLLDRGDVPLEMRVKGER